MGVAYTLLCVPEKTFNIAALPAASGLSETSLDLCGESIFAALADELLSKVTFMPQVVLHESTLSSAPHPTVPCQSKRRDVAP